MVDHLLADRHILVLEDNYFIALDLRDALKNEGANVLGPVSSVAEAVKLLERCPRPDAALLDVEQGEEASFPLADLLIARGVPFMFVTGANRASIPPHLAAVPLVPKPFALSDVVREVERLLAGGGSGRRGH